MAKSKKMSKSENHKKSSSSSIRKNIVGKVKLYQKSNGIKKSNTFSLKDFKKPKFEISNELVGNKSKANKNLNQTYLIETIKKKLDQSMVNNNEISQKKSVENSMNNSKIDIKKTSKKIMKKIKSDRIPLKSSIRVAGTYDSIEEANLNSDNLLNIEKSNCDDADNNTISSLPQVGFLWGDNMEDLNQLLPVAQENSEEEDQEVETTKAKPKLTKAERAVLAKVEEAKIRAAEDELLKNGDPISPDGFDRMILAQPDCSELWVKYMAYHLQATEIEKARAVARRALTVINIRREEDRLNVWTGLMNLEHLYGTRDSLQSCVHEALRCNDEVKVYLNLMNIYATSGEIRDLDSTVKLLLKKAGTGHTSVSVYLQCAHTLLQHSQKDTARHILQRGLNNLPPAVHVTLISRFALAENKHGDSARAQALFEHTLTSYPSRVDVWGVYVDMLVKSDRVDLARQVIQRAVTQKLPPKKLKPLYMKWLKLEEQYGDPEAVENVKKEIEQYVRDTRGKLNHVKLSL